MRNLLFPYKTLAGDINVEILDVTVDRRGVVDLVDTYEHVISLCSIDISDWTTAEIRFKVAGPSSEIATLDDVSAVAVANCGPTNTRVAGTVSPDPDTPGAWIGTVSLERALMFGQAELRFGVVASVDNVSNRIVGWSRPWTVAFDDLPDRPVIGGSIKITWVDFATPGEDKAARLKRHNDKYMYLAVDPDEPQLFLNRGFDGLEALLIDRRNRRDADLALHEQTRGAIAEATWMGLFNAALDFVEADSDDDPLWPKVDWQRAVLETILPEMYPDHSIDEALRDAYQTRRSPGTAGALQERLMPAAAATARAPHLLRKAIRTIDRGGVDEQDES